MTAKRKVDLSIQRKFYHHHSDDLYDEKPPKDFIFKIKKQNSSKQYNISNWLDDEEEFPLT